MEVDSVGNLLVNIAAGSTGNGAASATGSAVPAQADYQGLNIGGTLRGRTGVNPSGVVYAAQTDLTSVGGTTFSLGQQLAASSLPIVLTAAQITTLTPPSAITNYALETGGNLATLAGGVTASVYQINNKQVNGIAVSTGTGIMGTGVQRVAIASDNDPITVKQATGTNLHAVLDANSGVDIGKLTANQSVNNAQVNGVAVSTGTGIMGTCVQR